MAEAKTPTKKTGSVKGKKNKGGRPSKYNEELAQEICSRIAEGESLLHICKDAHMPHRATVSAWLVDDRYDAFHDKYEKAVNVRTDNMFDELVDISDDDHGDVKIGRNGEEMLNGEFVARSRLKIDTRKWYLSKVMPKKYGDKLDVTTDGKALPTPILGVQRDNSDEEDSSA